MKKRCIGLVVILGLFFVSGVLAQEQTILEVLKIVNSSSSSPSDDFITLKNVITGDIFTYNADTEGSISLSIDGKAYNVEYFGDSTMSNSRMMSAEISGDASFGGPQWVHQFSYFVIGTPEWNGLILEVLKIVNSSSSSPSDDFITLKNVITGDIFTYNADTEGSISLSIDGKAYNVEYFGDSTMSNSRMMSAEISGDASFGGPQWVHQFSYFVFPEESSGNSVPISCEASPLFTGASNLYLNQPLNSVKNQVGSAGLPNTLYDGDFNGVGFVQTIELGSNPKVVFAKQPTSADDPRFGLALSTVTSNYLYKTKVIFDVPIDFTLVDGDYPLINLFGKDSIVSPLSDGFDLILYSDANRITLSSDFPSKTIDVKGEEFRIELVSASDTAATIKVTNENDESISREINEGVTRGLLGLTFIVISADSSNIIFSSDLIIAANTLKLTDGNSVKIGESENVIDGTNVIFTGTVDALSGIEIEVAAPDSDNDAIIPGDEFVDPVFESFKIEFAGLNIAEDDEINRETIEVVPSGDDKMTVSLSDYRGEDLNSFMWAIYRSSGIALQADEDARNITVAEMGQTYDEEYIVIGNENDGHLLRVSSITNQTGTSNDKITFIDAFSGETITTQTPSTEGSANVVVGGKSYSVTYNGASNSAQESRWVRLNYPDSSATGDMVVYPTIETKKGAKFAFYVPLTINIADWDGNGNVLISLKIPNGNGYSDVSVIDLIDGINTILAGSLKYRLIKTGDQLEISIINPETPADSLNIIDNAALVIIEESSDTGIMDAIVVTLEGDGTEDNGVGVKDVIRTWSLDSEWDRISLASNSLIFREADGFGTYILIDNSDTDQQQANILYPNEQVYSKIYLSEVCPAVVPSCTSDWMCSLNPITCPSEGIQNVNCIDLNYCGEIFNGVVSCVANDCFGCLNDGLCVPFGYRIGSDFCSVNRLVESQLSDGICSNSYECASNFCSNGQCVSVGEVLGESGAFRSLYIKVVCRLSNLFGIENYNTCIDNYLGASPAGDYIGYSSNYSPNDFK